MSELAISRFDRGPTHWDLGQTWYVDLDTAPSPRQQATLSDAEQARAQRFVFAHDRARYVAGRAALRALLAECTGESAAALVLSEGPQGKPMLVQPDPARAWAFNLSHCGAHALIALAPPTGRQPRHIGIDLEAIRPLPDADELAAAHFTAAERASWPATGSDEHLHAFYLGWTRKEACLKALGWGLNVEPSGVETGLCAEARQVNVCVASDTPPQAVESLTLVVESSLDPRLGVISWAEWLVHTAPHVS